MASGVLRGCDYGKTKKSVRKIGKSHRLFFYIKWSITKGNYYYTICIIICQDTKCIKSYIDNLRFVDYNKSSQRNVDYLWGMKGVVEIDLSRDLRKHMLSLNLGVCEFSVYSILLYLSAESTRYFENIKMEKGQCVISQGRLSERTGCTIDQIRYALEKLRKKGLIEIEPSEKKV